jgi:hypothetical protein
MKKLMMTLMALCLTLTAVQAQQLTKAQEKAIKKEVKQKMKDYQKAGYQMMGSRTMEVALTKHYTALEEGGDGVVEFVGFSKAKSMNVAAAAAQNSAANSYASRASLQVKGRVLTDMASDVANMATEFDKFYAVYEGKVQQEIRGALKPSFSVKHLNEDGTTSVEAYYIVDERAANIARLRALENSLKESEVMTKYAKNLSNFVNEKVTPED